MSFIVGGLAIVVGSGGASVLGDSAAGATPPPWSTVASANPSTVNDSLTGVSCIDAADCMAVGSYASGSHELTLVESWNGTSWSVVPSPNPGSEDDELSAVTCVNSLTDCLAVGGTYGTGGLMADTLVESWNGATWTVLPSPNAGSNSNNLAAVSCTGATSCVAVGGDSNSPAGVTMPLIESWNGTSWSVIPGPDESGSTDLQDVSCPSVTQCTAVGANIDGSTLSTLIESWDGSTWTITPSPNPDDGGALHSVSCTSASDCMAVGNYTYQVDQPVVPLVESWNGTSWSVVSSPGLSGQSLAGVSCTGPASCVAVGSNLVVSWDGTTWSSAPYANPIDVMPGILSAVSCVDTASCVAVGTQTEKKKTRTLVLTNIPPPAPEIDSVRPVSGKVGKHVTITGTELAGAFSVSFNGTAARLIKDTSAKITTVVPKGATTGNIEVTTAGGTASSPKPFKVP